MGCPSGRLALGQSSQQAVCHLSRQGSDFRALGYGSAPQDPQPGRRVHGLDDRAEDLCGLLEGLECRKVQVWRQTLGQQ